MKRKIVIAIILLALIGAGVAIWLWRSAPEVETGGEEITVTRGDLIETAAATGTIEPHVQVEVKSRAAGEVIEVLAREGERVEAGALLVRLDPADAERAVREARVIERRVRAELAQAQASLAVSEAEAREADAVRDVQSRGVQMGLVSQQEERTATHGAGVAQSNVQLRRAQVGASRAQLETARLGVDDAERRLSEMEIRAPIAGTVLQVAVERGSIVSSAVTSVGGGTSLLTIADLSDLRVIGAIDESQIGRVTVGQPVVIRVDAYPDREFEGRVERVSPLGVATANVVNFDVEIVITDAQSSLLRSGMSADLEIETARRQGVLLVPLTAIQSRGAQRFVRSADGTTRAIRTGATDGVHIEVLDGVEEGERLVLASLRDNRAAQTQSALPIGPPRRSGSSSSSRPPGPPP
ncbi:MAG: efflux RND transporter periplasmic adaptor subunit [Sandaracinaceae bacterium]|nr:efflux RND transporter periplasmic adaptor subunit [Sandaracinaceae bacterium]